MPIPSEKPVSHSSTEQVHIVLPAHSNGCGRLFGGQLMQWIDVVAAVCARRHSERNVVTVCVEGLDFEAPAYIDQVVVMRTDIVYTGTTSMEVRVDSFVEDLHGDHTLINRAYLILVALDDDRKPTPVPAIVCETSEQKMEHQSAVVRAKLRKSRHNLPN